jgi:hypothetical protein
MDASQGGYFCVCAQVCGFLLSPEKVNRTSVALVMYPVLKQGSEL